MAGEGNGAGQDSHAAPAVDAAPKYGKGPVNRSTQPSSNGSSDAAPVLHDGSFDRAGASSEDLHGMLNSPMSATRRPNLALTESALHELNQTSGARKGQPSSTGGTTANTRPADVPDMRDLPDVPPAGLSPRQPNPTPDVDHFAVADMPAGTPPPVAEGLSLIHI